jgi:23S rRNA G2069 N7-methylase RlmK/C1962 C5-methylase RlmI
MVFNFDLFSSESEQQEPNSLMQYLQRQNPEVLERIAQSATPEVKQLIAQNVQGLVGMLPPEDFQVQIATDRENLAHLLASAMMTGYFLSQVEQRRNLEVALSNSEALNPKPPHQ